MRALDARASTSGEGDLNPSQPDESLQRLAAAGRDRHGVRLACEVGFGLGETRPLAPTLPWRAKARRRGRVGALFARRGGVTKHETTARCGGEPRSPPP